MRKLQIRLTERAESLLGYLEDVSGAKTREVVLDALALYHWAVEEVRQGKRVGSIDPETAEITAVATPTLQAVANEAVPAPTGAKTAYREEGAISLREAPK